MQKLGHYSWLVSQGAKKDPETFVEMRGVLLCVVVCFFGLQCSSGSPTDYERKVQVLKDLINIEDEALRQLGGQAAVVPDGESTSDGNVDEGTVPTPGDMGGQVVGSDEMGSKVDDGESKGKTGENEGKGANGKGPMGGNGKGPVGGDTKGPMTSDDKGAKGAGGRGPNGGHRKGPMGDEELGNGEGEGERLEGEMKDKMKKFKGFIKARLMQAAEHLKKGDAMGAVEILRKLEALEKDMDNVLEGVEYFSKISTAVQSLVADLEANFEEWKNKADQFMELFESMDGQEDGTDGGSEAPARRGNTLMKVLDKLSHTE